MKLFVFSILAVVVPAVFAASLGVTPLNSNPSAACLRINCDISNPWIQESRAIIQASNADCKVVKATLDEFVHEKIAKADRSAHPGTECANYQAKLISYLRAKLLPQNHQDEVIESDQPKFPHLHRRMAGRDCGECSDYCVGDNCCENCCLCPLNWCVEGCLPCFTLTLFDILCGWMPCAKD
ncbi:hypothetical protein H4R33_005793 [Dimargaris cristalligena]|nr:hypothetical protein H4R33_005793 [Dimargaris cristalligena]